MPGVFTTDIGLLLHLCILGKKRYITTTYIEILLLSLFTITVQLQYYYRRIRTDQKQSKKIYLTIIKRNLINTI